jgi:hypothetical protein
MPAMNSSSLLPAQPSPDCRSQPPPRRLQQQQLNSHCYPQIRGASTCCSRHLQLLRWILHPRRQCSHTWHTVQRREPLLPWHSADASSHQPYYKGHHCADNKWGVHVCAQRQCGARWGQCAASSCCCVHSTSANRLHALPVEHAALNEGVNRRLREEKQEEELMVHCSRPLVLANVCAAAAEHMHNESAH